MDDWQCLCYNTGSWYLPQPLQLRPEALDRYTCSVFNAGFALCFSLTEPWMPREDPPQPSSLHSWTLSGLSPPLCGETLALSQHLNALPSLWFPHFTSLTIASPPSPCVCGLSVRQTDRWTDRHRAKYFITLHN